MKWSSLMQYIMIYNPVNEMNYVAKAVNDYTNDPTSFTMMCMCVDKKEAIKIRDALERANPSQALTTHPDQSADEQDLRRLVRDQQEGKLQTPKLPAEFEQCRVLPQSDGFEFGTQTDQ